MPAGQGRFQYAGVEYVNGVLLQHAEQTGDVAARQFKYGSFPEQHVAAIGF